MFESNDYLRITSDSISRLPHSVQKRIFERKYNIVCIHESYEWCELKKLEGWKALHITIVDNETLKYILIAQVLIKKIMGIKIGWCPGGPLIQCDKTKNGIDALDKFREAILEENIFNLRCKPYMEDIEENQLLFSKIPKSKLKNSLSSRYAPSKYIFKMS